MMTHIVRPTVVCLAILTIGAFGGVAAAQTTPAKAPTKAAAPKAATPKTPTLVIPPAVEAAFKRAYPQATIKKVSKEKEDGVDQYEVESVDQGLARDLMYLPDGKVVSMEEELSAANLPPAVAAAIKTRYPKATITKRERLTITKGNVVQYEAALTGASVKEAILAADGTWVSPKPPAKGK